MCDTDGRLLEAQVQIGDTQDRDGAVPVLKTSRTRHPLAWLAYAAVAYNSDQAVYVKTPILLSTPVRPRRLDASCFYRAAP
jgi:hypothetical protein